MSKKNTRPEWHEPVSAVITTTDDPIEDTIEVGEVILVDGPIDPVPLGAGAGKAENYNPPRHSAGPMPDLTAANDKIPDVAQVAQNAGQTAQDVVQDVTQKAQETAQGVVGKVQEKAQSVTQAVTDKTQDITQGVTEKVQDAAQKITEAASSAKTAVPTALETAKAAVPAAQGVAGKIGAAASSGAKTAGGSLWTIVQRNPLQALLVLASVIWLLRNNKAAASQPTVSLSDAAGDAAEKVGTVAGQVQVAASNLSTQVSEQTQRGAGWFTRTLQENPLAIGAMAIVFGAGLGFAIPETPYEDRLLGAKRDELAAQAQAAAQDLTQKVTAVAQTAVHEVVETVKTEAKNQGLSGELTPESAA